jgi:hypothetical protein
MTIALAGRRVDAADASERRFPLTNREIVRARLRDFFEHCQAKSLVCSAACGADLIALDVAGGLGLRRRVVLPFSPARFRAISVVDRPGDWGPLYDWIIAEVNAGGDLVTKEAITDEHEAFEAIIPAILDEAEEIASSGDGVVTAVIVWEGRPHGDGDLTHAFVEEARRRGMATSSLGTL